MAVEIEENGRAYYEQVAASSRNETIQQIFNRLAQEEKGHARAFQRLNSQFKMDDPVDQTTEAYLSAIKSNIFPFEVKKTPEDKFQALAIAIQAEKDAILFYFQLYEIACEPSVKKVIAELLKAEKLHLVELRQRYEDI